MISQIQIQAAKRSDLPGTLMSMGVKLIPCGNSFHLAGHDSLKFFKQDGVWLYKWWSQGGEVGDGIQYLQRYLNMNFSQAVETLSGTSVYLHYENNYSRTSENKNWKMLDWQKRTERLIQVGIKNLFGPNGKERMTYLANERGLRFKTAKTHRLGWLPAKNHMPSKIVIPCYNSKGILVRVRFRIDEPEPGQERYRILKGSDPFFPFPLGIIDDRPVMIVESELDAILIGQECRYQIGVLALGSTSTVLSPSVINYLNEKIPITFICLDNDGSGRMKTDNLMKTLTNAINWPVPERYGKDPGEAWKRMSIGSWVDKALKNWKF